MRGLTFWNRHYSGSFIGLIAYHPPSSLTWYWAIELARADFRGLVNRAPQQWRRNQWHDLYRIPLTRWAIRISRQDYHKEPKP